MFEENTQIIIEEKRSGQQTETGKRRAFPDNQERQKPARKTGESQSISASASKKFSCICKTVTSFEVMGKAYHGAVMIS